MRVDYGICYSDKNWDFTNAKVINYSKVRKPRRFTELHGSYMEVTRSYGSWCMLWEYISFSLFCKIPSAPSSSDSLLNRPVSLCKTRLYRRLDQSTNILTQFVSRWACNCLLKLASIFCLSKKKKKKRGKKSKSKNYYYHSTCKIEQKTPGSTHLVLRALWM